VARPRAGRSGRSREEIEARAPAWAERTALDQGLPAKVRDPQTLASVAELFAQARQTGDRRDSSKRL
jgi:hypothetical protein